ncbi:MAG: uncharacterized protein K0R63_1398 [Rickettsiales bacterium]|jgi:hypothetical protein|nr:uncharacterized protein [Rickettsiales bacterium]
MKKLSCLVVVLLCLMQGVSGCSWFKKGDTSEFPLGNEDARLKKQGKLTGEDGFVIFGKGKGSDSDGGAGVGVNSVLWRAALDTVSFMPIASADPFGGTIITDWYEDPAVPNERFKLNVLILGTELRSDALRVSVFKQSRQGSGWRDAAVAKDTARELEDKILTRARELRVGKQS